MNKRREDPKEKILIVGHGLAGAVLAHQLLERGIDVEVIDAQRPHSASTISAGLIHPFIGPKMNLPSDYEKCLQANDHFFGEFLTKGGQNFLHSIDLIRIFRNPNQRNRWPDLAKEYRKDIWSKEECAQHGLFAEFGAGVTQAYQLDTAGFLRSSRALLEESGRFSEVEYCEDFSSHQKVVFCEGFRVIDNKWFNWLPFSPAQGEILCIEPVLPIQASNGTWYLTDHARETARAGSTWNHDLDRLGISQKGKEEILSNLSFLQADELTVCNHTSGVRSSTRDRQPILGQHPKRKNLYLFNGFGSRGSTTIARCAKEMIGLILDHKPLGKSLDLNRFLC